ncbi:DNA-binding protein [Roseibium aquae]|uniref:Heat shock protein HspQ n=2 Tax=Roseibium aquae TaxID=1323746 RepID=A0A916TH23_9HYPH|nr:DNA-binding protein [Roseibium aquae]
MLGEIGKLASLRRARYVGEEALNGSQTMRTAKFSIGQVVRHRIYPFRGVIFDVDPTFSNTEEWWEAIPEDVRPVRDQPFYHLLAENEETEYVAYVSEQNLVPDMTGEPIRHPQVDEIFEEQSDGSYLPRSVDMH